MKSSSEVAARDDDQFADSVMVIDFYVRMNKLAGMLKNATLQRHLRLRGFDWRLLDDALSDAWATAFVEVGH